MIKFIGEYTVKLDDKGRLILPSAFKSVIDENDLRFVIKKDLFANCLEMFTYSEWLRESESVKSRLNFFNREHTLFWREYTRDRALVEPAEKLGRISVPKRMLDQIGVTREVVFAGSDHKIEIWAKENYQETKLQESEYIKLAEKILG
ncbi:MAG: hypothetical protein PHP30_01480 [Bacteroidales bacterium]|nr:hypothetical protein [Bacteroidales bacterium]MDD3988759.1 hypothetical protein [Bacteroidales bacterium]